VVSYEEALQIVLAHTPVQPAEEAPLSDCAGRALAAEVYADQDNPPYTRSAMDGYALRAEDVAPAPAQLRVVDHLAAGHSPSRAIGPGECAKIMTGAVVPAGADTVVMLEDTSEAGAEGVIIARPPRRGDNICLQGENFRAGDKLLPAGQTIGAPVAALLATLGRDPVPVHRRPTVSHLATGDEVVPVGSTPRRGQVRDSNSVGFSALLAPLGLRVENLGIAADNRETLAGMMQRGLQSDVFAVTAGVSRGDCDYVPEVLGELGVEVLFETVALKPGKPTIFGKRGDKVVFGLPGNPVAAQVVTQLLVLPALRRMSGHLACLPPTVTATLTEPCSHRPKRRSQLPAIVRCEAGRLLVTPVPYRGSGDMLGLARGNALLVLAAGVAAWAAGDQVEVVLTGAPFVPPLPLGPA
jgi:molybdopterin molybdotransferase